MMTMFDFAPDPGRATALDRGMYEDLAGSLALVFAECRDQMSVDALAIEALIQRLEASVRHEPGLFALYYELVDALLEERWDDATARWAELARARPAEERFRMVMLGEAGLGPSNARYQRLMCSDPSVDINFLPPAPDKAAAFAVRLHEAMALLDRASPRLAGEVRGIIDEVVLVAGDPSRNLQFDGGSHFQLWGALFLNTDFHATPLAVAEVIAHESAHSLLFGLCRHDTLVENPETETYASPLRTDPRPMFGIFHATFVSARMYWAMASLIDSGLLDAAGLQIAADARDADHKNFFAGYSVVREHGVLTPLGSAIMGSAAAYMDRQPSPNTV